MATRGLSQQLVWRRRAIALALVAAALLAGYYLWLRDSSLVAVEEVQVEGATANRDQVAAALEREAKEMTTLHIDDEKLRDTASAFPTVASIKADASLLHSLTITVTERLPVARVESDGEQLAVSADGYALAGVKVDPAKLPPLQAGVESTRLDEAGQDQAAIVGAAPAELRERVDSVRFDPELGGVVVEIEGAPELRLGDGGDGEAKWEAVAAVLANPDLGSPAYLDASVPERPVTGG
jgi:cell division protein FtsQ